MFPSSSRPKWSMRRFNATSATRTANHLECCTPSILTFRPLTGCELQRNWYGMGRDSLAGSTKTSIPWKDEDEHGTGENKIGRTTHQVCPPRGELGRIERARSLRGAWVG